ncbi:MAG TPA: hotdog fold domain-containing protein [Nocardioides sp.]|nr:hotdog fold domain-containing protein [Nocardioides sp.]
MSAVKKLWNVTTGVPVIGDTVGKRVFSFAFAQKAPYFATIHPRFTIVEPNHVELVIPKRRSVQNHIGTVHAIALCNGMESAMGALAEVTISPDLRWIPKGMEVAYTAKASTDITVVAETDQAQWDGASGDLPVRVKCVRADGTVVAEGKINLWISKKK